MKRFIFIIIPVLLLILGSFAYFNPQLLDQRAHVGDPQASQEDTNDLSKKIAERLIEMGYLETGTLTANTPESSSTSSTPLEAGSSSPQPPAKPITTPKTTLRPHREKVILISAAIKKDATRSGALVVVYPQRDFMHDTIELPTLVSHAIVHTVPGDTSPKILATTAHDIYAIDPSRDWTTSVMIPTSEFFLRRITTGDVDGDGRDELAISTHKNGQSLLFKRTNASWNRSLLDEKEYGTMSTENHDILMADFDGDGRDEILATPTTAKKVDQMHSWGGTIKLFDFVNGNWQMTLLDRFSDGSFVRRLLFADANNDGRREIVALLETSSANQLSDGVLGARSLELLAYAYADGTYKKSSLIPRSRFTFENRTTFTTTPYIADVTGSGKNSIVIANPMTLSIFRDNTFETIDRFSGISLVAAIDDIDADGVKDIITYSTERESLLSYSYKNNKWVKRNLADIKLPGVDPFIWSIEVGEI